MMTPESKQMREQHGPIGTSQGSSGNGQLLLHFGNYDLIRRIDVGGMGEVYLARQRTAFNREVAVKIIRSDLVHDMMARKRFLREAEVSAHLKHEHILPLVEFGEEQGRLFLVTPYIEGGTLARRLLRGPLSLAEVQQLFSALVRAIAYIHRRGVIHRDLKPNNILLDQESGTGQVYVRLIDFGIATISGMAASAPLTTAGHEMGTIAYMAPERLEGVAAPSNDIYSLGVILYQMLTGQIPTSGKLVTLPPPLETVVRHCMALNLQDRYASADEVLIAFEYACRSLNESSANAPLDALSMVSTSERDDTHTPKRLTSSPPISTSAWEDMSDERRAHAAPLQIPPSDFKDEDYRAQTTFIAPKQQPSKRKRLADEDALEGISSRERRGQRSFLAFMLLSIVIVLLCIAGTIFLTVQTAISATITISPQVHAIENVFTITAKPNVAGIDINSQSIPAVLLKSDPQTAAQQGQTTGQNCLLFVCQQAVAQADVDRLAQSMEQNIRAQVGSDLQKRVQGLGASMVGDIQFADVVNADPPVGSISDTVKVTVTVRGGVEYFKTNDAQDLARQLLNQQVQPLGPNYVLLDQMTRIGQPQIEGIDAIGVVTLQIPASGLAKYQFPPTQLTDIQNYIKGMKLNKALAFLKQQPGVDASTVTAHMSYGDTLPNNVQQIKLTPVEPTNLPPVQLPTVQPSVTPTASP